MRFAPSPEQQEFAASLADLLAAADTPSVVRAWSAGDHAPGRKLWSRLAELGVTALTLPGEHGGFGDAVDLVIGFEQLGRYAVPGPWVESVAVLPVLLGGSGEAHRLDGIVAGDVLATVAVPPAVPLALDADAADAVYTVDGATLHAAVPAAAQASVDRSRRLAEVAPGEAVATGADVARALDLGALATAAQILGAGAATVEMATRYAAQRVQFGRPVGSFQAVKHQLADAYVGLDLARPLLLGAALAVVTGSPTAGRDVSAAKVACTDAAYRASRAALQVHGAIGYTSEYDLALWLTKIRALTGAYGTQAQHRARVLAALVEGRAGR